MGVLNPNLPALEATAKELEPLIEEIVFVGGTISGLLIDDPGAGSARPTHDVDVVAEIAGTKGYLWAIEAMAALGFQPDSSPGAPVCRWAKNGLVVDLMGTATTPFGPTNPWYAEGFQARIEATLPGTGQRIYILPAPLYLLTKWEAFLGRGLGSMTASHDIEDMLNILEGHLGLADEAKHSSANVQSGLAQMAARMLASQQFCDYCLESLGDRKDGVRAILDGFLILHE
jgi:hypothetical protein